MKTKDIKKLIQQNIESHIPETAPKLDIIWEKEQPQMKKSWTFNYKLIMNIGMAVLVLVLTFALWPNGNTPNPPAKLLNSDNEIISFSAVSSISLFSTIGNNELISQPVLLQVVEQPQIITTVLPYLKTAEQLLLSDPGMNIITGESNLPEYTTFMQFETRNLIGHVTQYEMHYNLSLVDEDDEESEFLMEGILLFGVNTYQVIGEKKIEDDEEKVEFKAYKDDSNYVESLYKIENDEQTFEFKVVQQGLTISESKYEIEFDQEEIKVKLTFQEGSSEGQFEFEYFTEDGKDLIQIEFEIESMNQKSSGEMVVEMYVDDLTGVTKYRIMVNPDDDDPYEYETEDDDEDEDDEDDEDEEDEDDEDEEPEENEDTIE
jgi:hypothetical protein